MVGYLIVSEPVNHHPVEKKDQAVKMVDDPLDLNFYLWMVLCFPFILLYFTVFSTFFGFLFLLSIFKMFGKYFSNLGSF